MITHLALLLLHLLEMYTNVDFNISLYFCVYLKAILLKFGIPTPKLFGVTYPCSLYFPYQTLCFKTYAIRLKHMLNVSLIKNGCISRTESCYNVIICIAFSNLNKKIICRIIFGKKGL